MNRSSAKKGMRGSPSEARKTTGKRRKVADSSPSKVPHETCVHCQRILKESDRALFVEEEISRIFCSEGCIAAFFAPEIEKLEKEYFKWSSADDLTAKEREEHAHLRWVTLQEPEEAWRQRTLAGDTRYTLIAEFKPGNRRIWCICICLCLRGEPSFLYLAFPTIDEKLVDRYRRGERIAWDPAARAKTAKGEGELVENTPATDEAPQSDGLADEWTADETFRAQLFQARSRTDIPSSEYAEYQDKLEGTLEEPDEVWAYSLSRSKGEKESKFYHFLRRYGKSRKAYWYIVVARELEDEEQIEILDAFPSRDAEFVAQFKLGKLEHGAKQDEQAAAPAPDESGSGSGGGAPVPRVIH